jgi:hypothetical protein
MLTNFTFDESQQFEQRIIAMMKESNIPMFPNTFNKNTDGKYESAWMQSVQLGYQLKQTLPINMVINKARVDEYDKFFSGTVGVLYANSFEMRTLWNEYNTSHPGDWVENLSGILAHVGHVVDAQVWCSLRVFTFKGSKILVVEDTSRIVDHTLIEEWIKFHSTPTMLKASGYVSSTDANNFHNMVIAIERQLKAATQDVQPD